MSSMPVVWSPQTRAHEPLREIWVGVPTPGTEVPARVDAILTALADRERVPAEAAPAEALTSVHEPELVDHLATAYDAWRAGPYEALVGQDRVVPYVFATPAMTAGMPATPAAATHARAGEFCYDTMTLIGPGSWPAIRAAAGCALAAADLVSGGLPAAYALCRPPGHHVTPRGFGGSCYLNNAALAAQRLRDTGAQKVAIVDIDAHHGNGTQAIFWQRPDVVYASVHVDPADGWFPHHFGHAHETGAGPGAAATLNVPLPEGAGDEPWLGAVRRIADWVTAHGPDALVVSLGVDAAAADPESPLLVTHDGYRAAGVVLGALGLPSVVVQEGGYHLQTLGTLVAAYLEGHEAH